MDDASLSRIRRERRRLQALSAVYALITGSILVALLPTLRLGAVGAGLAVMIVLAVATGLRSKAPGAFGILVSHSFAFFLLMSPVWVFMILALWGPGE